MKITLLLPDVSLKTFYRAKHLYNLLKTNFDLEVIAVLKKRDNDEIFKNEFSNYKKIVFDLGTIVSNLEKAITGNIVYAIRTKSTSFGFAMSLKNKINKPVILDIITTESTECYPYSANTLKNILFSIPFFKDPNSFVYTYLLEKRIKYADDITVSSPYLQKRYGGTFIPNVCDINLFEATQYKISDIRDYMSWGNNKIILYNGYIDHNIDITTVIKAIKELNRKDIKLVIVGEESKKIKNLETQEPFISVHKTQPQLNIAKLVSACDILIIPLKKELSSFLPSKLFEALSCNKAVIASNSFDDVKGLENMVITYEAENHIDLKNKIEQVLNTSEEKKTREVCLEKYNQDIISKKLIEFFNKKL